MFSVMTVDDYPVFLKQLRRLKLWERQTLFALDQEAADGEEALQKLRQTPADLLITDIVMPKVSGIELMQQAKRENLCRCAVLLSEHTDFEFARQGLILGAFDYLVKPVDDEKLGSMLARCAAFLDRQAPPDIASEEKRIIIETILEGGGKLETKAQHLLVACFRAMDHDAVRASLCLLRLTREIHRALTEREPWLERFVRDIRAVEKSILHYEDYATSGAVFEKYLRESYVTVKKYKLGRKDIVKIACLYILCHSDEKITLGDAAAACFTNRTYLSHVFKLDTGMSFSDYVNMVKLERTKKLIRETDLKVLEIAARLGYENAEYLSRCFKSGVGMSPSEYRKRHV